MVASGRSSMASNSAPASRPWTALPVTSARPSTKRSVNGSLSRAPNRPSATAGPWLYRLTQVCPQRTPAASRDASSTICARLAPAATASLAAWKSASRCDAVA